MPKVKRTIQFYKLQSLDKNKQPPTRDQLRKALSEIDTRTDFHEISAGEKICIWHDTPAKAPAKSSVLFSVGKIRTHNIPGTMEDGSRASLLANNVLEQSHAVLFGQFVLGAEWNQYGPRVFSQLPAYLGQVFESRFPPFLVRPLFDIDIVEVLNRFNILTMMSVDIEREKVGLMNNADPKLSSALKLVGENYPIARLALQIKLPEAGKLDSNKQARFKQKQDRQTLEQGFSHKLFEEISAIIADDNALSAMKAFTVTGHDNRTGTSTTLNLLERKIFTRKDVPLIDDTHGMVKSDAMYAAIVKAHEELLESIKISVAHGAKDSQP